MMADQPPGDTHNPADARTSGLLEHLQEFCASGLAYLQARLTLAGLEAKEALVHFGIIIGLCVLAVSVVVFGYLFLCIALTVLIADALHVSPGWVILALALLHFLVAMSAVLIAFFRLKVPVFEATLNELKKDRQWMNAK